MKHETVDLIRSIEAWLTTGKVNPDVFSEGFVFSSPFWKKANKDLFLSKFHSSTEYIEKALSKIKRFDTMYHMRNDEKKCFAIIFKYHTKNNYSVDETVFCKFEHGLITEMLSIYDLLETKKALELE